MQCCPVLRALGQDAVADFGSAVLAKEFGDFRGWLFRYVLSMGAAIIS